MVEWFNHFRKNNPRTFWGIIFIALIGLVRNYPNLIDNYSDSNKEIPPPQFYQPADIYTPANTQNYFDSKSSTPEINIEKKPVSITDYMKQAEKKMEVSLDKGVPVTGESPLNDKSFKKANSINNPIPSNFDTEKYINEVKNVSIKYKPLQKNQNNNQSFVKKNNPKTLKIK